MPSAAPPSPSGLAGWAQEQGVSRADLLAGLLLVGLDAAEGAIPPTTPLLQMASAPPGRDELPVAAGAVTPDLLGEVLGATAAPGVRRSAGAVFTPRATADGLVAAAAAAAEPPSGAPATVLDPSVGGGAFTLAVARALAAAGAAEADAVRALVGRDTDPLAVAVTRAALGLWSHRSAGSWTEAVGVVEGDFLAQPPSPAPGAAFQLVVGNPPFQSQLRGPAVRSPQRLEELRARFGSAVGPYTDTAALFLLAALEEVEPGGVVALVQPRSFLGADGTAEVRRQLLDRAAVVGVWEPAERIFAAAVDVCALVLVAGAPQPADVAVWSAPDLAGKPGRRASSEVLPAGGSGGRAPVRGHRDALLPAAVVAGPGGCLGDVAEARAGFRDQFYGMAPWVREAEGPEDPRPRLLTSGLIDPGAHSWGRRPARFAGARWSAPVLELSGLDPDTRVGRWVRARLVPKIVVASQTKVIEAVLDPAGIVIPSPPCVSVEAPVEQLELLLAALLSPTATVWLHHRAGGTGLAPGALRVSVQDLLELPLPADREAWAQAAALLPGRLADDAASRAFGQAMAAAYGVQGAVAGASLAWWAARLPAAPEPPG